MSLKLCVAMLLLVGLASHLRAAQPQVLELRRYTLVDEASEAKLDAYLKEALVPALERQGLGPIGAFAQASREGDQPIQVMLLIAGDSADAVTGARAKLADDKEYQEAAKEYLATPAEKPVLKRIESELMRSFAKWPEVKASEQKKGDKPRLFELRTYESPTEHLGDLKVEMFNDAGEIDIFLDCDIQPVFMGQALVGSQVPNLTYMTVYDDAKTRDECWKRFLAHPDWEKLKEVKRYLGTVSKIDKSDWVPKPYSQL